MERSGTFDGSELRLIEYVAGERLAAALDLRRTPLLGTRDDAQERRGAAGEYAVAMYTGRAWNPLRDALDGLADVGDVFEVKAIWQRSHGLIVPRRQLHPERTYFVVHVELPRWHLIGAVEGDAIREADYDATLGSPAFRIRQGDPRFVRGTALERFRAPAYERAA